MGGQVVRGISVGHGCANATCLSHRHRRLPHDPGSNRWDQNDFPRILEVTAPAVGDPDLSAEVRSSAPRLALTAALTRTVPDAHCCWRPRAALGLLDDVRAGIPSRTSLRGSIQVRRLLGGQQNRTRTCSRLSEGNKGAIPMSSNRPRPIVRRSGTSTGPFEVLALTGGRRCAALLAIRAEILVAKGPPDEARRDLSAAVAALPTGGDHDAVLLPAR